MWSELVGIRKWYGKEVTFKLSSKDSDDLVEQMGVTLTVLLSDKA